MFPFCIRPKTTLPNFTQLIEKMNSNQLTLEDILDNDDLITDLKTNTNSQFLPFFSDEVIKKLIDYSTKMPSIEDQKHGHKYPFNATEILCSENIILIEKIFNESNLETSHEENNEKKDKSENEEDNEEEILPVALDDDDLNKKENIENDEEKKEDEKKEEKKEEKENEKKEDDKKEEKKEEKENEKKEDEKKEEKKEEKENEKEQKEENKPEEINEKKNEEIKNPEEKNEEDKKKTNEKNKEEEEKENNKIEENKKEEESKIIYENLDYFFKFLNSDSNDDNYVLIGYFNRILNNLISIKGEILIKYIYFSKPEILTGLIRHLNRKAISEVVNKLITYEDEKIENLKAKKISFIKQIIKELSETKDELKYEWICDLFINTLNKKEFFFLFTENEDSIKLLYSILSSNLDNTKKLKNILNVLIKLNETILSLFENPVTPNLLPENPLDFMNIFSYNISYNDNFLDDDKKIKLPKDYDFKAFLEKFFNILKENNFSFLDDLNIFEDIEIETPYLCNQKKLGTKKLAQIEFFRSILDILVNAYAKEYLKENIEEIIKLAEEKNIFWILHEIFLKFEFNNIFQTLYLQIITIAINKFSPKILVKSLLINSKENKNLINVLIEHSLKSLKFKYKSNAEVKSGFFPAEIQILNDIFESENEFVKKLIENELDLKAYNEILANEINGIFKQKLLFSESNDFNSNNLNKEIPPIEMSLKSFYDIVDENVNIYNNIYKKGEDYLKVLEEKRKKEKEEKEKAKEKEKEINNMENNEDNIFPIQDNDNLDNEKTFQKEKLLDINQKPNIENEDTGLNEPNDVNVMNKDIYNDNNFWKTYTISESEGNELLKDLD